MRKQQVYGKRQTAQQRQAAQIFTNSSSPPEARESGLGGVDAFCHGVHDYVARDETAENTISHDDVSLMDRDQAVGEGLDVLSTRLCQLSLTTDNDQGSGDIRSALGLESPGSSILRERNANARPRLRNLSTRNVKKPATHKHIVNIGIHTRFDDAGLVSSISEPTTAAVHDSPRRAKSSSVQRREEQDGAVGSDVDSSNYAQPLLDLCGDVDGRARVGCFQEWSDSVAKVLNITKIAEASFGEVYRLSLKEGASTLGRYDESVLKVMALKSPSLKIQPTARETERQSAMSELADVANEARLLRHMSPVPGFTNFRDIRVLQGRLPKQFVTAWKSYNKDVKKSMFPDPSRKANYREDQLWAVIEMQDAGIDLETVMERHKHIGVFAVWDIFWGVTGALAKGEEWAEFEHRDLHMGNICVRSASSSFSASCDGAETEGAASSSFNPLAPSLSSFNLNRSMNFTGIETTLIDYTLSRAAIKPRLSHSSIARRSEERTEETHVAFFDLSKDEAIFAGDAEEEYQYDIYRFMRATVLSGNPAADIANITKWRTRSNPSISVRRRDETAAWRRGNRATNLVWLHFVLHKLLEAYDASDSPVPARSLPAKRAKSLEETLLRHLRQAQDMLEIEELGRGQLSSAGDLIMFGIANEWLRAEDVLGVEDKSEYLQATPRGTRRRSPRKAARP